MICLPLMGGNQKGACAGDMASALTCTEGSDKEARHNGIGGIPSGRGPAIHKGLSP